jgi:putative ABC transport system permease protein
MFDIDKWQEIFATIRRNLLRTVLTAFAVAWGIFILIVLLGFGEGLQNGVVYQFRDDAVNSIWVSPGQMSVPWKGLQPGRRVQFTNSDLEYIERMPTTEYASARNWVGGDFMVSYKTEYGRFDIRGVIPDYQFIENVIILEGHFINEFDQNERRKTAVIGETVEKALFKNENSIGKFVNINGINFQVVGIFEDKGGEGENEIIYIPLSTAQLSFNSVNKVNQLMFTIGDATIEESKVIADRVRTDFSRKHQFDPKDERAIYVRNNFENFQRFFNIIVAIKLFVWVIGLMTIIAGVVGVSNIMMIVVKERTREFGVRKALGATPWSIVSLILQESIFITSAAGYLGLLLGVVVLDVVGEAVKTNAPDFNFFLDPRVDLKIALTSVAVLVVAGALAGLAPALRAASIQPIEALRDE